MEIVFPQPTFHYILFSLDEHDEYLNFTPAVPAAIPCRGVKRKKSLLLETGQVGMLLFIKYLSQVPME